MEPFEAPANANHTSATTGWLEWPMAAYAVQMDLAARQWAVWTDAHRAMVDATARAWGAFDVAPRETEDAAPPAIALATADLRAAGRAMWRAQMDAVDALRRSA